ncbi:MAG: hypothetical protein AAF710_06905 [Planctomycetota bacterium]
MPHPLPPATTSAPPEASPDAPPALAAPAAAPPPIVQAEPALSLLEIGLRNRGKLIACGVLALTLGVIYQLTATPQFQSTAEVFVLTDRAARDDAPLAPGGLAAGMPSTQAALLGSNPVLLAALEDPAVNRTATIAGIETPARRLRHLQTSLDIGWSEDTETVSVTYRDEVPADTAAVVNGVVHAYLKQLRLPVGDDAAGPTTDPDADAELAAVFEAPGSADGSTPGEPGVLDEQMIAAGLMALSEQRTTTQSEFEAAAMRYDKALNTADNPTQLAALLTESGVDPRNLGLAELAFLRAELARLDQQLAGMPASWGPQHKVRGPIQRQAEALRGEVRVLRTAASDAMLGLLQTQRDGAADRLAELDRRIAADQARAAALARPPVDFFQPALEPIDKVAPRGVQTMGIALFLGLAAGLALTLRSEMKRPSTAAALPPAAAPARAVVADDPPAPLRLGRSEDLAAGPGPDAPGINAPGIDTPPLLGQVPEVPAGSRLTSPNFDATASSIHQIRAVLQVQARKHQHAAFAFTSPRRGAGKTSVTIGVASSLAMSGTRTLVVDCDLAGRIARGQTTPPGSSHPVSGSETSAADNGQHVNGQAHDPFGPIDPAGSSAENASLDNIAREQGYVSDDDERALASEAAGQIGITGVLDGAPLEKCVVPATVPGLALLPAVHATTAHIGKMSDRFIRELIDRARADYDLVLFDTGPVPGSVEALLVTSQADGVIVVVPQGEQKSALDRTMSYLKVVGAKVAGTVFNRSAHAPDPGRADDRHASLGGAAAMAAAAGASRHAVDHAGDGGEDPLVELERQQNAADDDGEYLAGDAPLGSGILAAAVFSDADSDYANQDWKLEETSEFNGSVEELFGKVDDDNNTKKP